MDVAEAVAARHSVRQFLPEPVPAELLIELVEQAARAPSGGNLQPWRIYVVNGPAMSRFRSYLAGCPELEIPEYDVYPHKLWEPYRTNRFALGEQLYASIGIPRSDREARLRQFAHNADFFGAPAALFCFVDRGMGAPQWSDLGMFLQTFMLLAVERGLGTCAQEYWAVRHAAVAKFVAAPEQEMLFCAVAVGYEDSTAAMNGWQSQRMDSTSWLSVVE